MNDSLNNEAITLRKTELQSLELELHIHLNISLTEAAHVASLLKCCVGLHFSRKDPRFDLDIS